MKLNSKKSKALAIVASILAFLCIVTITVPAIGKWRDKAYFSKHRQAFNDLISLAENSDCEGRCIEPLPDSVQMDLESNSWLLCYGNSQLIFVSVPTPSDNHFVYAANPDEFPQTYLCGYDFIGLDPLDSHWYFAKVVVYN